MNNINNSIIFVFALFFLFAPNAEAQDTNARSSAIYLNAFGNSITYALTYDTRFTKAKNGFGGSIGAGAFALEGDFFVSVPLQVNYLFGKKVHFFEIGAGVTYLGTNMHLMNFGVQNKATHNVLGSFNFMYRIHIPQGFFLRVGWTPLFGQFHTQEQRYFLPPNYNTEYTMPSEGFFGVFPLMGGIGLGYCIH